jgi:hypothetical protein
MKCRPRPPRRQPQGPMNGPSRSVKRITTTITAPVPCRTHRERRSPGRASSRLERRAQQSPVPGGLDVHHRRRPDKTHATLSAVLKFTMY